MRRVLTQDCFFLESSFQRLVFSDDFIDGPVRRLWNDTRDKILNKKLVDVVGRYKDGRAKTIGDGSVSTAPNFLKSHDNPVFMRGGGADSSATNKTECVNGIKMLEQFVWIRGRDIISLLDKEEERSRNTWEQNIK